MEMQLTERQLACLHWAALGKTSWEMAKILGVTERTVNYHIDTACRRLQVTGRQAAITLLLCAGQLPGLSESPRPAKSKTGRPRIAGKSGSHPEPSLRSEPVMKPKP